MKQRPISIRRCFFFTKPVTRSIQIKRICEINTRRVQNDLSFTCHRCVFRKCLFRWRFSCFTLPISYKHALTVTLDLYKRVLVFEGVTVSKQFSRVHLKTNSTKDKIVIIFFAVSQNWHISTVRRVKVGHRVCNAYVCSNNKN